MRRPQALSGDHTRSSKPRPRSVSLLALAIASAALIASSYGPPGVETSYRGETAFEAYGQEWVVRATVSLDPVAAAAAESAFVSAWPAFDLATHEHPYGSHPLAIDVRQVGPNGSLPGISETPGVLDISACRARPGEPCLLDVELRLTWTGPVPTTAAWELQAHVSFAFDDSDAIERGARVEIVANDTAPRLPAIVLAGLGGGLLAAILATRRLAATGAGGRVRRLAGRAPLVLAVALLAGAGWLLAATGGVRVVAHEQVLAILLAAQAAALFVAHARRNRDDGLAEKLAISSVAFGSLPVILLTVAARQAYQPIAVLALVATLTFVAAATVFVREPLVAPSTGKPLTMRQRAFIEAWVAFATLMALAGVTFGVFSWGWNAWFAGLDPSQAQLIVPAFLLFVAVGRWLHGRSRMLTLLSAASIVAGFGLIAVSLAMRLPHPWLPAGDVVLRFLTEPIGVLASATVVFGVVGVIARRLRPSIQPERASTIP